ncbi:MAG TPA: MBL fold metallo-hydrolase [Pseudonocardia sp.]|uniref:MBL fold metallo-hydrolase n=1 Tax=Pseudonocardia sp. TaxID=60912 RepID=UPI002B4B8897|nr:MBL fold metallo-hydrolase [Pseudonocardia sp.]HLU58965.1 MBL fold metallo-hydrolase [Pseudonocardia sp.]
MRDLPAGHDGRRWVANAATLVWGDEEAVLVDTFPTTDRNERLIDWIRDHGRRLVAVYITHGHGAHAPGRYTIRDATE